MHWKAIYGNGSFLSQYNENGNNNKYIDIDRNKLVAFELYNGNNLVLRQHLEDGKRLIYRKRVALCIQSNKSIIHHLIGWQQTVNGKNIQSIAYISEEDGSIELAGAWRNDRKFYSPNLLNIEK